MEYGERVQYLIDNRNRLETLRHEFAVKHGFAYTRSQNFKNCIVIRWKPRKKYEINYPRIEQYVAVAHGLCDQYNLWDEKDRLLESGLMLINIGIYCFYEWSYTSWAIPNEYKEIQDVVLSKLPSWAKVTRKV